MSNLTIRRAKAGDEPPIVSLLRELADYERLLDRFHVDEAVIRRDYLGALPLIQADLAFEGDMPVGIANWTWIYASFAATRVLFLEDLYVRPQFRGRGHGKALLAHLARIARDSGAPSVQWDVLAWNKPSIAFYESLGATTSGEWLTYTLSGDALAKLASA